MGTGDLWLGHGGGGSLGGEALMFRMRIGGHLERKEEERRGKTRGNEARTSSEIPCWFGELKTGAAADMIRWFEI